MRAVRQWYWKCALSAMLYFKSHGPVFTRVHIPCYNALREVGLTPGYIRPAPRLMEYHEMTK